MKKSPNLVKQIASKIVAYIHPEKIILFGSHVDAHRDEVGDVDILVITNLTASKNEQILSIEKLFKDRDFPLDILVYSVGEVEQFKNVNGSLINAILRDGKMIYDRAA